MTGVNHLVHGLHNDTNRLPGVSLMIVFECHGTVYYKERYSAILIIQ